MGLCNSPEIFQEKMYELFVGLETVSAYIDDLLNVTKGSWTEHLTVLEEMSTRLLKAGLNTPANYDLAPTNVTIWVITSLVTGLFPYQRKSRPFKPSQIQKLAKNCVSLLV